MCDLNWAESRFLLSLLKINITINHHLTLPLLRPLLAVNSRLCIGFAVCPLFRSQYALRSPP
jgi:hypothetical protein